MLSSIELCTDDLAKLSNELCLLQMLTENILMVCAKYNIVIGLIIIIIIIFVY